MSYKQIELPSGSYLLADIEPDASDIQLHKVQGVDEQCFTYYSDHVFPGTSKVYLPRTGQWSIIGKADELKEEDWKGIVEWEVHEWGMVAYPDGRIDRSLEGMKVTQCKDYLKTSQSSEPHYCSFGVIKSGLSLIASHNLNSSTTLILKLQP